jgi:hypothetical protein
LALGNVWSNLKTPSGARRVTGSGPILLSRTGFAPGLRARRQKAVFMRFPGHSLARAAVLTAGLVLTATLPQMSVPAATPVMTPATGDSLASYRPEVRLRKLHLVRPDLIPYPLAYEVYC